jgi:hypothetical protein
MNLRKHIVTDKVLEQQVVDTIVQKAKGMYGHYAQHLLIYARFLMAQFHVEILEGQLNRKKFRAALQSLSDQLNNVYDSIMDRIWNQNEERSRIANFTLEWITYAKRQLQVDELLHAIAIYLEPHNTDIDLDDLMNPDDLISFCAGIVTIDQESNIIRLVHYTAQNYLLSKLPSLKAHSSIARTCLSYFGLEVFAQPILDRSSFVDQLNKYKLSHYMGQYWGEHAEANEKYLTTALFDTFGSPGRRVVEFQLALYFRHSSFHRPGSVSFVHVIARNGLSLVGQAYLDKAISSGKFSSLLLIN